MIRKAAIFLFSLISLSAYPELRLAVSAEHEGVYAIPYGELREMGFSSPEELGLLGREGAVPVLHDNSRQRIVLFLKGPESHSFSSRTNIFINEGRDIYSNKNSYYLTDAPEYRLDVDDVSVETDSEPMTQGMTFIHHELDLHHNNSSTGNLFWGEGFNRGEPSTRRWPIELHSPLENSSATLSVRMYYQPGDKNETSIGTNNSDLFRFSPSSTDLSYFRPNDLQTPVAIKEDNNEIIVSYNSPTNTTGVANIDYWTLSYPFAIGGADLPAIAALPYVKAGQHITLEPQGDNMSLFIVSEPYRPRVAHGKGGKISFRSTAASPIVVFFNESEQLPSPLIDSAISVAPKTLTPEILAEGADMLIVAPGWLMDKADAIADLHRDHDSMKVMTASLHDIYATFSAGNPTPYAVRDLVHALASSSVKPLRNLLLLGPLSSDIRNADPLKTIIAPQTEEVHVERHAYSAIDFYVANSDLSDQNLMNSPMKAGAAILPVYSLSEADTYIAKIKKYLKYPFAHRDIADLLWIGGEGDAHTHERQTNELATLVDATSGGTTLGSILPLDAFGIEKSLSRFFSCLNEGRTFTTYIGHAGPDRIGKASGGFLTPANLHEMHNRPLTFFVTAGCSSTNSDRGERGIPEHMTLSYPTGAIGGLVTNRETWSSQNFSFVKLFFSTLFGQKSTDTPLSIGEIYALAKTECHDANSHSFLLLCDPALKIPVPTMDIKIANNGEMEAGTRYEIKGTVCGNNGKTDTDFNGRVRVKLLAEPETLKSTNLLTGANGGTKDIYFTYADRVLNSVEGEVSGGKFDLMLPLPENIETPNNGLRLHISAFDADRVVGGATMISAKVRKGYETAEQCDAVSPVVEDMYYDPYANSVSVRVSDDTALSYSSGTTDDTFSVFLDGHLLPDAIATPLEMTPNDCVRIISLPDVQDGEHTLDVIVCDLAGNKGYGTLNFSAGLSNYPIRLTLEETAATDHASFRIDFLKPVQNSGDETVIIVENMSGDRVASFRASSDDITIWETVDSTGNPLPAGLYNAFVRNRGADGRLTFSKAIRLPIVRGK